MEEVYFRKEIFIEFSILSFKLKFNEMVDVVNTKFCELCQFPE